MTDADTPFVLLGCSEILGVFASLKGVYLNVFFAVGAFSPDPIAPSLRDLCDYTRISKPSVSTALRFLCKHELAHCFVDEDGVRRYRADERYFRYRASAPVSVRELVPIAKLKADQGSLREVKKDFTSYDDDIRDQDPVSGLEFKHHHHERRKIFSDAGYKGPRLDEMAAKDAPLERARAWAEWTVRAQSAPKQFPKPYGYAYRVYMNDPCAEPPEIITQARLTWYGEYAWAVHGTPEHTEHLRQHPEWRELCECWEMEQEKP